MRIKRLSEALNYIIIKNLSFTEYHLRNTKNNMTVYFFIIVKLNLIVWSWIFIIKPWSYNDTYLKASCQNDYDLGLFLLDMKNIDRFLMVTTVRFLRIGIQKVVITPNMKTFHKNRFKSFLKVLMAEILVLNRLK